MDINGFYVAGKSWKLGSSNPLLLTPVKYIASCKHPSASTVELCSQCSNCRAWKTFFAAVKLERWSSATVVTFVGDMIGAMIAKSLHGIYIIIWISGTYSPGIILIIINNDNNNNKNNKGNIYVCIYIYI